MRIFLALTIVIMGTCAFLFNSIYRDAKNATIRKLNEQQTIHAEQAARGIEDFFATQTKSLNALAQMDQVIAGDAGTEEILKLFYETQQTLITAIARVNEKGVMLYDYPDISMAGTDLSNQNHIRELLRDHKPVISDVFKAVEGFDTVALHVPVFSGAEFKGSVGVLTNFTDLAKRYLDVIKIGATGYAWVVSRDGKVLYSPATGFTGKSVVEVVRENPSLDIIVKDMLKGHKGAGKYTVTGSGDGNVEPITKYVTYIPAHVGNTFWSICVESGEQDVLASLITFRNKLTLVICVLFICGMVLSKLATKVWLILNEEEKRKQTELQITKQRSQLTHLSRVSLLGEFSGSLAHELSQPLTSILSNAQAAQRLLAQPQPDLNEVRDILMDIVAEDKRAGEIIRGLRQLLKSGEIQFQPLSVNELVQQVLTLLHSDLMLHGVIVRSELTQNLPLIRADQVGIQQVLINLVINSCDAMAEMPHEQRQITIRTSLSDNDFVLVSVSDNGHGIAQEKLEEVFEPFYTNKVHGMGLGLSVCRTIITVHGGKLWATDNSGRGATFQFSLPGSAGRAASSS